jgi:hypothetical protein
MLLAEVGKAPATGLGTATVGEYTRPIVGLVLAAGLLVKKVIQLGDEVKCTICGEFFVALEYDD